MEVKKTLVPIIATSCMNNKVTLMHKIKTAYFIKDRLGYRYYIADVMIYGSPLFIINANS